MPMFPKLVLSRLRIKFYNNMTSKCKEFDFRVGTKH